MNKRQRKKAARKRYVIGCAGGLVVLYDTVTKETSFSMAHDIEPAAGIQRDDSQAEGVGI